MNPTHSALVVIDIQEKLLPHIRGHASMQWNVRRLLDGAQALGVRTVATEQYPAGLGPTVEPLHCRLGEPASEKLMFSCRECADVFTPLRDAGIQNLLLTGIETHICVAQSALDFLAAGFNVLVAVDAVGSRHPQDHEIAIRRLESSGVTLTTTEAALFEWCERAGSPEFKIVSKLAQEHPPQDP